MAAVVLVAGCTGTKAPMAKPATLGAAGFGNLKLGMAKDAALATGKLGASPTSTMRGCEDFSYKYGPPPDPARMAAGKEAEQKSDELNRKADELNNNRKPLGAKPGAKEFADSAAESAAIAEAMAKSAEAIAVVAEKDEARDKAFRTAGGVSFSSAGVLRAIALPVGPETDKGISMGSPAEKVKKAYEGFIVEGNDEDGFTIQLGTDQDARLQIAVTPDRKVATIMLISPGKC